MRLPTRQETSRNAIIYHECGQNRATRRNYIQTPSGYQARGGHAPDTDPPKPARRPSRTVTSTDATYWAKSNKSPISADSSRQWSWFMGRAVVLICWVTVAGRWLSEK
jgi:hypothetical protein